VAESASAVEQALIRALPARYPAREPVDDMMPWNRPYTMATRAVYKAHPDDLDDALPYDEPWGWMQPTRHALDALLMEQGHLEEAEAVYRADLGLDQALSRACQHLGNLWSLNGLHECLTRRGETVEAPLIKQQLDQDLARAEVPVYASCYCRQQATAF
jgi:hypothetical protein